MKCLVIGSGASGIIAALRLSKSNEVILIEKNDKIGKKILATGNGKCNIWNTNLFENLDLKKYYYTDNYDTFNNIFKDKFNKTYKYLTNDLNIYTKEKNEYIYPYSNTAFSVRQLFEREIMSNPNINLKLNEEVLKIEKYDYKYKVLTTTNQYIVDKVIISCGSKSSELGTNSLENLLKGYDIKINNLLPALVPIKLDENYLNNWNGIRTDAKLTLKSDDFVMEEEGELQLTDYGISGIVTLNISGYISQFINENKKISLSIDFMNDISNFNLKTLFNNKFINSNKTLEEMLETYFNYKLLFIILKKANLDRNLICKSLSDKEINILINTIKNFNVNVIDTIGFKRSQVTTGGISLDEVDNKLMLKKLPNVYVTGEILDINGKCGGFNLAVAFTSGYIIGDIND